MHIRKVCGVAGWNIQSVAGGDALGIGAECSYSGQQVREGIRDGDKFGMQAFILHAFQDLVEPVQAAAEPVVGPAPHAASKLCIVFAALSGGSK
ncbi:hypothetical protein GCM10027562_42050 [Arthrobacter pigmenti]